MNYITDFSDKYKKSLIGKLPSWAWMIIYGVLSAGAGFFLNQTLINMMPYQFTQAGSAVEMGNMWWIHIVMIPFNVLFFELILFFYGQLMVMLSRGGKAICRKDFTGIYRAFYCGSLVVSGLLQIMCYFNSLTTVWYAVLGVAIPRLAVTILFFMYIKKQYLDASNTHIMLRAVFLPYLVFEILSLAMNFI